MPVSLGAPRRPRVMTTVGRIHLVLVPTTGPDRSIAFYASLGFAKRADFPYEG